MPLLEEPTAALPGGRRIPSALDEAVAAVAVLVDRAPAGVLSAIDAAEDRVEVPRIASARPAAGRRVGVALTALPAPLPDRLIRQEHATLGRQLLHVALAQGKPKGAPDGVRHALRREAMPGGVRRLQRFHAPRSAQPARTFLDGPS